MTSRDARLAAAAFVEIDLERELLAALRKRNRNEFPVTRFCNRMALVRARKRFNRGFEPKLERAGFFDDLWKFWPVSPPSEPPHTSHRPSPR